MDNMKLKGVERWLAKAEHDIKTAELVLQTDTPISDVACLHAQQCAEKALKSFLVYADIHVEKTHSLPRLVELCSQADSDFTTLEDAAINLTDYAVTSRYPDTGDDNISAGEASEAINARYILEFVKNKLNK